MKRSPVSHEQRVRGERRSPSPRPSPTGSTAIELSRIIESTCPVVRAERTLPRPGGVPDGSQPIRGSARRARTPGSQDRIVSTPEGCQNRRASTPNSVCCSENDGESFLGVLNGSAMRRLCHPSGVKTFFVADRGSELGAPTPGYLLATLRVAETHKAPPKNLSARFGALNSNGSGAAVGRFSKSRSCSSAKENYVCPARSDALIDKRRFQPSRLGSAWGESSIRRFSRDCIRAVTPRVKDHVRDNRRTKT
jgi:hypothetical protein